MSEMLVIKTETQWSEFKFWTRLNRHSPFQPCQHAWTYRPWSFRSRRWSGWAPRWGTQTLSCEPGGRVGDVTNRRWFPISSCHFRQTNRALFYKEVFLWLNTSATWYRINLYSYIIHEYALRLTSLSCSATSSHAWSGVSPDTPGGCLALLLCLSGAIAPGNSAPTWKKMWSSVIHLFETSHTKNITKKSLHFGVLS